MLILQLLNVYYSAKLLLMIIVSCLMASWGGSMQLKDGMVTWLLVFIKLPYTLSGVLKCRKCMIMWYSSKHSFIDLCKSLRKLYSTIVSATCFHQTKIAVTGWSINSVTILNTHYRYHWYSCPSGCLFFLSFYLWFCIFLHQYYLIITLLHLRLCPI